MKITHWLTIILAVQQCYASKNSLTLSAKPAGKKGGRVFDLKLPDKSVEFGIIAGAALALGSMLFWIKERLFPAYVPGQYIADLIKLIKKAEEAEQLSNAKNLIFNRESPDNKYKTLKEAIKIIERNISPSLFSTPLPISTKLQNGLIKDKNILFHLWYKGKETVRIDDLKDWAKLEHALTTKLKSNDNFIRDIKITNDLEKVLMGLASGLSESYLLLKIEEFEGKSVEQFANNFLELLKSDKCKGPTIEALNNAFKVLKKAVNEQNKLDSLLKIKGGYLPNETILEEQDDGLALVAEEFGTKLANTEIIA